MKKRILQIALLGAMVVALAHPVAAADCVSYNYNTRCVWDAGCWANPLAPNGQYWDYVYCVHADGTQTQIDKYESGGCCTP